MDHMDELLNDLRVVTDSVSAELWEQMFMSER